MSFGSIDRTVITHWTSLRRPLTKVGRSGRSIRRQARTASVEGRPSLRKNEPGIRPAAYIRSSTSTVSGKKSNPSRGLLEAVVVASSIVPSSRYAVTDPPAWRASWPVSRRMVRVPKSPLSIVAVASTIPNSVSLLIVTSRKRVLLFSAFCSAIFGVAVHVFFVEGSAPAYQHRTTPHGIQ